MGPKTGVISSEIKMDHGHAMRIYAIYILSLFIFSENCNDGGKEIVVKKEEFIDCEKKGLQIFTSNVFFKIKYFRFGLLIYSIFGRKVFQFFFW